MRPAFELPDWFTFPDEEWPRLSPEQAGFDPDKFQEIAGAELVPNSFGGRTYPSFGAVIVRGGYLVHEWGDPHYREQTASVGKAFTWALVGLTVQEGLIDPNEPIHKYWTGEGELSHPHKYLNQGHHRDLTWRHLLEHRGGFPISNGSLWRQGVAPAWAVAGERDPFAENYTHAQPGQYFYYSSGGYWRLSQALTAVWGRELKDVLDEKLFSRMDLPAERWDWLPGEAVFDNGKFYPQWLDYGGFIDPPYEIDGNAVRGGGGWVVISASDLARFGLLVAAKGQWKGEQLLDPAWLRGHDGGTGNHVSGDHATGVVLSVVTATGAPRALDLRDAVIGPIEPARQGE